MIENKSTDKIQSLFLSYQDMKTEVRKLESDLEMKKNKKFAKEKELNAMESKIRARESYLYTEKTKLSQCEAINAKLKEDAEKERVEQYAVYLELLEVEESIKALNEDRMENKSKYARTLKLMAHEQFIKREELKKSLTIFSKEK